MPIEAYEQARQLKELGLEKSIPKAFANAMKEYRARREKVIEELLSVRTKHSELLQSANQKETS